jgi:hypothetical protein
MDWLTQFLATLGPGGAQAAGLPMTTGPGPGEQIVPPEQLPPPVKAPMPPLYTNPVVPSSGVPGMAPAPYPLTPFFGPGTGLPEGAGKPGGIGSDLLGAGAAGAAYAPPGQTAASVGGNAAGAPLDIRSEAQKTGGAGTAQARGPSVQQGLAEALRGVQAMAPPQAQRVDTPPPPRPHAIGPSNLVQTLMALGIGPQEFTNLVGRRRLGG